MTSPSQARVRQVLLRRILAFADGRSAEEITEQLYSEELAAGAWLADVGLLRSSLVRDVARAIKELEASGHLRLEPQ